MRILLLLFVISLCACGNGTPIPKETPFKIGETVCVGEKWVGIVDQIEWHSCKNKILKYKVHKYDEPVGTCCNYEYFLESQLSRGKCDEQ